MSCKSFGPTPLLCWKLMNFINSSFLKRWGTIISIRRSMLHGHDFKQKYNTTEGNTGHIIAQAVRYRPPTAAARVRSQVKLHGLYSGQNGTGAGFLRVLRFPLPLLIPPNAACSSIVLDWYNRPISGRRTMWIQSHPKKVKVKKKVTLVKQY
jgi:hypothetical protein